MASSSSPSQRYDVFLSFRGADTRKKFVSHLYRELQSKCITIFKDDRVLQPGDSLPDELPEAIKESKIAVVVISENYASSRWCLKELEMIMELKKKGTLDVFPIFYDVYPADVRDVTKLEGAFGKAFQKHEGKETAEKVGKWREALTELANLTGLVSRDWPDEADMVYYVGHDILKRLLAMPPEEASDLIGMDTQFEALEPFLSMGSDDEVRMIGIWGMGGTGKTTIARYAFDKFRCQFPFSCFIENVKKIYSEQGRENLRRKFLSQILNDERLQSESFHLNSNAVQDRLSRKKVLAILDDVDHFDQLEALAKQSSWFGPGSRIIITTRNKGLLRSHEITLVHVECLEHNAACSFFNCFAFSGGQVPEEFKSLAIRASKLVGGLPLALKVLGSFLRGRGIGEWEVAVQRLRDDPREDVMKCLKLSYDGLNKENQHIFLTVACLFNEEHTSHVSQYLEGEEREVRDSLNKLVDKALIGISNDGKVIVHDLIHDMAKEIANNGTERPRFLEDSKEICNVLAEGVVTHATEAIEGISLDISEISKFPMGGKCFENMRNLRYLKIHNTLRRFGDYSQIHVAINHLPSRLRVLNWHKCPLRALPSTFDTKFLVELRLPRSRIEKLSEGTLSLGNLRRMDLSSCYKLKEISNLEGATKLEELDLSWCTHLVKVPPSFSYMKKLTRLSMRYCKMLKFLSSTTGLKSLKVVDLCGCSSLKSFPELPKSVVELNMSQTRITEVPASIQNLVALEILYLSKCKELLEISSGIGNLTALKTLKLSDCRDLLLVPHTIGNLRSVKELHLCNCKKLKSIPDSIWNLTGLKILKLSDVKIPFGISKTIGDLTALTTLNFSGCEMLLEIPSMIGDLRSVKELRLQGCKNLGNIPDTIGNLMALEILSLDNCSMLSNIPSTIGNLTALKTFSLSFCEMLVEIPSTIGKLTALETLQFHGCTMLSDIPITIGNLTSLKEMSPPKNVDFVCKILNAFCCRKQYFNTSDMKKFLSFYGNMEVSCERASEGHAIEVLGLKWRGSRGFGVPSHFSSLSIFLHLRKLSLCNLNIQEISDDLGRLQALQSLDLSGNTFEVLPKSIKELTLLEELVLSCCQNLRVMPELPQGVKYLYANGCSLLESVYNVSRHPFSRLMLNGCFNLGEDPSLLLQHMISMPFHTEEVNVWACFSASELPDCFYNRRKEQKLTIYCPQTEFNLKPVGFVAGVVIRCGIFIRTSELSIHCHWHGEGRQSGHIHVDFKSLPSPVSDCGLFSDLLLVFSHSFGEEKTCDKLSFYFDLNYEENSSLKVPKIKGCGIHFCFADETQQKQTLLRLEVENVSDPRRAHQLGDNGDLNNEEEGQRLSPKRRKFSL